MSMNDPVISKGQFVRKERAPHKEWSEEVLGHANTMTPVAYTRAAEDVSGSRDDYKVDAQVQVNYGSGFSATEDAPRDLAKPGPASDRVKEWHDRTERRWYDWDDSKELEGQTTMFRHESKAPSATLEYMAGTKGGRFGNMTAMGIAANDAMKRGLVLQPSDDLSPNSERLVNKLQDKGMVAESFSKSTSNKLPFWDRPLGDKLSEGGEVVPQAEVDAGKRTLRGALKGRRSSGGSQMSMQFDNFGTGDDGGSE